MPPDTSLFPSLYGNSPGEAEVSQDITDTVLPLLSAPAPAAPAPAAPGAPAPPADPLAEYPLADASVDVSTISPVPNYDVPGQLPAAGPGVAVVDGQPRPPQETRRRSMKDRISSLIGQRNAEREGRGLAEQQLEAMTNALLKQGEKLDQFVRSGRAPAQPPVVGQTDPITGEPAAPQLGHAAPVTSDEISQIVAREIGNYDQRLRTANDANVRLQLVQEESYEAAVEDIPALADPNSAAAKTFTQVWARSPLRSLEDGPYQVALQVAGLIAEDQAANQTLTARKRQASINNPQPTATDTLGEGQKVALTKEYQRISGLIRAGSKDPDLLFKFRKLGRALGRTAPRR